MLTFDSWRQAMDKSEYYIQMCTQATEIQKQWSPNHGDFFVGENGGIYPWIAHVHDSREIIQGVGVSFENGMPKVTRYIWLPRLDQLMEIAQDSGRRFENTTQIFFEWIKRPYQLMLGPPQKIFSSLEQLWLSFIMNKNFRKQWDGQEWQIIAPLY